MMDLKEIRKGDFVWRLVPGVDGLEPLLGRDGFRLELAESSVVKHARHRTVHRAVVGPLDLHVKHYRGDARDWFRCLIRGKRAAREFSLSQEVARRGVPTIEVLGYGECARRWGPSDSVLLTRTIPNARPLLNYLEYELPSLAPGRRELIRRRLAAAVGRLIARQHQAGVCHEDLHPGNMLVRFEDDEPRLFLIDLDSVKLGPPMNWRRSRENLVVLDRWFAMRFSRVDRLRAWRAYLESRSDLCIPERVTAKELAEATQSSLIHLMRQFDRRCLGGNRHYTRITGGLSVTDLDWSASKELLIDPESVFRDPRAKILKQSPSSTVIELEASIAGQRRSVICKRFTTSWKKAVGSLVRWSPAMRSYVLGHGLRLRGLPTPRPLAIWRRSRLGFLHDTYLLMEKIPDAVHLREHLERLDSRQRRWELLDQLARLLRQLHEAGLSHRDLKAANVLVSPADYVMSVRGLRDLPPCSQAKGDNVWFVDLVGVQRLSEVSRRRRVRDLARLHVSFLDHPLVSRTDRLRLLRTYVNWGMRGKAGWKEWWREIDQVAKRKVARNRLRGRVVG